jgi:hypothetical protein
MSLVECRLWMCIEEVLHGIMKSTYHSAIQGGQHKVAVNDDQEGIDSN